MKVAVCGNDRIDVIKELEKLLKTESVRPKLGLEHPIVDMANETYGQNKRTNVVFDGCVLEYLTPRLSGKYFDVYEQIALTSLVNIDKVYVVTAGMSDDEINMYKDYNEFLNGKIVFVSEVKDVTV